MLASDTEDQLDQTSDRAKSSTDPYPTEGLRVGINHHSQTIGKHRIRFSMDAAIAKIMGRGLIYPRVHFSGDMINGLRIWCEEEGGMSPTASYTGAWSVTVPVRRLRGREQHIGAMDVAFEWERDKTGPVMIVPRLPDALLPEAVIDKLPNSQVDPETRMERAETRLKREMAKVFIEAPEETPIEEEVEVPVPEGDEPEPMGEPTHLANLEAIGNAPNRHEVDLKDALAMVNEIVDRLGDGVALSIDEFGHVRAKRRIVNFIDL